MPDEIPRIPRSRGKTNKPKESTWIQQRLPSYRPVITAFNALPWTTVVGLLFLGIGLLLKFATDHSLELQIKYTNCTTSTGNSTSEISDFSYPDGSTQCHLSFSITENFTGNVKFYYGLREFYQNNRLYIESRNDVQLIGNLDEVSGCKPLDYVDQSNITYAPCGLVANSMFNDSFQLLLHGELGGDILVPFTTRNMVSDKAKKRKFRNPTLSENETLCDAFKNTERPPWWQLDICQLGAGVVGVGVGFENIDFMMWMQTAALPNFRKLYRILDTEGRIEVNGIIHNKSNTAEWVSKVQHIQVNIFGEHYSQVDGFREGLPNGMYTLVINYNYPATWKGAEKSFIIVRESWIGTQKQFLAFAYIVVGVFLLLVSILFLIIYVRHRILEKKAQT